MRAALFLFGLSACAERDACPVGEVRDGDSCATYAAADPVPSTATPLAPGVTWQWQITGDPDLSHDVAVYDLDLFDLTAEVEAALHADGRVLICYFSAGSYEPWRDDADAFPDEAIGRTLDGWPDERWVDPMHPVVRQIMVDRLDRAVEKGCDGVEPDNVTAAHNATGFGVNLTEQLDFNRFLADAAHERGLGIALKNDVEQVADLIDWFDYTVNEECAAFDECDTLRPFVQVGKAVLHTEYVDRWDDAAAKADEVCGVEAGFSTIVKTWDLGPELLACD